MSATWIAFGAAMIAGPNLRFAVLRIERRRKFPPVAALLADALGTLADRLGVAAVALFAIC